MFRTELKIPDRTEIIDLTTPIFSIGSCFANVMGERFLENKMQAMVNPFGVIFNPISIARILKATIDNTPHLLFEFTETENGWFSFHLHSDIYADTPSGLETIIRKKTQESHEFLIRSKILIITLGTAYIYRLNQNNIPVANCHKVPSAAFTKDLLKVDDIIVEMNEAIQALRSINKDIQIILTVSPVRHIKDTLTLNSVSKSVLRVATHELAEQNKEIIYFPSYEMMMDDLRDYRFYKEDMIHPSPVAEDYIWEKFKQAYMTDTTIQFIEEWASVRKAMTHKAFRPESEAHKKFIKATIDRLKKLSQHVNLDNEIREMQSKL
ncbi:MAG TPA: GSCFA domain-containing protein [Cytophagaceae bacterium]